MKLLCEYDEIDDGAGLTVEILESIANVFIIIEYADFSNNRGRSGAGTCLYIRNSPNKVILKTRIYYNNTDVRFYVSASALMIHMRKPKVIMPISHKQIHVFLLQYTF